MKKKMWLSPLIVLTALVYAPVLFADNTGLYLGLGVGRPNATVEDLSTDNLPFPDVFTSPPTPASTTTNKSSATTWMVFGGYQFNRYLAIEGLYAPLGEYNRNFVSNYVRVDPAKPKPPGLKLFGAGSFEVSDKLNIDGFGLTAVAKAPLSLHWAAFAKVGVFRWRADLSGAITFSSLLYAKPPNPTYEEKETGYSPIIGIGGLYNMAHGISIRAEWMKINNIGGTLSTGSTSVNSFLVGAQVNF